MSHSVHIKQLSGVHNEVVVVDLLQGKIFKSWFNMQFQLPYDISQLASVYLHDPLIDKQAYVLRERPGVKKRIIKVWEVYILHIWQV